MSRIEVTTDFVYEIKPDVIKQYCRHTTQWLQNIPRSPHEHVFPKAFSGDGQYFFTLINTKGHDRSQLAQYSVSCEEFRRIIDLPIKVNWYGETAYPFIHLTFHGDYVCLKDEHILYIVDTINNTATVTRMSQCITFMSVSSCGKYVYFCLGDKICQYSLSEGISKNHSHTMKTITGIVGLEGDDMNCIVLFDVGCYENSLYHIYKTHKQFICKLGVGSKLSMTWLLSNDLFFSDDFKNGFYYVWSLTQNKLIYSLKKQVCFQQFGGFQSDMSAFFVWGEMGTIHQYCTHCSANLTCLEQCTETQIESFIKHGQLCWKKSLNILYPSIKALVHKLSQHKPRSTILQHCIDLPLPDLEVYLPRDLAKLVLDYC